MNEGLVPIIVDLMKQVLETCAKILSDANAEIKLAKEKGEELRIKEFIDEVKILEQLINIANAIIKDVQEKKISKSTPQLLLITSLHIARIIHPVATKRNMHKIIITNFKEAADLINTKF